ncbi:MAG: hypothetical protein Q9213_005557 [Squamulea squamosa]
MASYNKLATLMGEHQDMVTFRKFQRSNAKSLLYMQAEILHLENELAHIESEDRMSEDKTRSTLHESVFNLKEYGGIQWKRVLELREKLESYNKALILFSRVQLLPTPSVRDLRTLQEWLDRPEGGDFFLQGREADVWDDDHDVLTLSPRQGERDGLTGFVNDSVIPCCPRLSLLNQLKSSRNGDANGVWHYRYDRMTAAISLLSIILSSLLPSTSIFVLFFLANPVARLAAIIVFTTIFSSALFLTTKARRIEVFAATTAWGSRASSSSYREADSCDYFVDSLRFRQYSSEARVSVQLDHYQHL